MDWLCEELIWGLAFFLNFLYMKGQRDHCFMWKAIDLFQWWSIWEFLLTDHSIWASYFVTLGIALPKCNTFVMSAGKHYRRVALCIFPLRICVLCLWSFTLFGAFSKWHQEHATYQENSILAYWKEMINGCQCEPPPISSLSWFILHSLQSL